MTENPINNLLNPSPPQVPPSVRAPAPSAPSNGGGSGRVAGDATQLRNAAKAVPEVNSCIRTGGKAFPAETAQAAAALGDGWATANLMSQVSSEWLQALNRMVDEIDYLGDAVNMSAVNWIWAEEETKQKIDRIRTGAP